MSTVRTLTSSTPPVANDLHFYMYDEVLSQSKYSTTVAEMETRLTDLGLQGHIGRLGPLKNAKEMVREALQAGARTIVAVGTDQTFTDVINAVAGLDVTVGIIPINDSTRIGRYLGIENTQTGCKVLAARKIEAIDLGRVNTQYFLTDIVIETNSPIQLECDNNYQLEATETPMTVIIANMTEASDCRDGTLSCFIDTTEQGWFRKKKRRTTVPAQRVTVQSKNDAYAVIEGTMRIKLPIYCEAAPQALKVIVGKNRIF